MSGPVKGLLAPGLMEQPQGLLDLLYPQGWRGGIFGMGNPTGAYLDQKELSRPGVNPGASPMSNRDLARQYAVNIGSGMGTDAGAPASIGAGLLGTVKMYHGTPHTFDAFDLSKIGTGEGAQAYGHGLYFAENPKVAKEYRDALSDKNVLVDGNPISEYKATGNPLRDAIVKRMGESATAADPVNAADVVYNRLRSSGVKVSWANVLNARNSIEKNTTYKPASGNLYTVEHPADPEDFLHWDKPLSEQSDKVKAALSSVGLIDEGKNVGPSSTGEIRDLGWTKRVGSLRGEELYRRLIEKFFSPKSGATSAARKKAEADASAFLKSSGIPGIRYLDQGSRGSGGGTHNYVVFDDKPLKILSRE